MAAGSREWRYTILVAEINIAQDNRAVGLEFDVRDTLEVLVTGVLLVGVLGIAAAIPWAVGGLVDLLTGGDSR